MLQVTQEATTVLKEVRDRRGAPPEAGLRIHQTEQAEVKTKSVTFDFQNDPEPTDQTIEMPDLRIFVSHELVEPLSNRVLDVKETRGTVRLTLR